MARKRSLRTHRGQLVKPSTKGNSVKYIQRSLFFLLCVNVVVLGYVAHSNAQPTYHIVQPGDTLWDICEHYYGDSELWPKLWEMNPFVTNPHLLKPGDKIRLLEGYPLKTAGPHPEPETSQLKQPEEPKGVPGVEVSGLCNVASAGYLSSTPVAPIGRVISAVTSRIILAEGDTIFVDLPQQEAVEPGSAFMAFKSSSALSDPLTGRLVGYLIRYGGKVSIKERAEGTVYKAKVIESYTEFRVGDLLIPVEPITSCVQVFPTDPAVATHIVAVQDQKLIIGQFSVVYLPKGFNDGVRRGNVFRIMKKLESVGAPVPDVVEGHLIVIEARPDSATGVVISLARNLANGAPVQGAEWAEVPDLLSILPQCRVQ
jgi:LysM repeat protein